MSEITIAIDIQADLKEIVLSQFPHWGFERPAINELYQVLCLFYNLMKRVVLPKPRGIVKSREFICPPELDHALEFLESKISTGESLNGHLSRQIVNLEYRDALLNDWGIQHLHLGTAPDPQGRPLVEGTSRLLFVRFAGDTAYLVQILDHHAFAEQRLLQIIHDNWPQVLEPYRLPENVSLIHPLSETERKQARKVGITAAVEMSDGTVYHPPGGGLMSDGTALVVIRQADRTLDLLEEVTAFVKQRTSKWQELLKTDANKLHFQLKLVRDNHFCIVEQVTGIPVVEFYEGFGQFTFLLEER